MPLLSGTKLGPYEILALLGAGGMGEVYRATDTRLNRTVAIKVLSPHLSDRPDSRERFEREAQAISSLNHPNICHLYDVGTQNGVSFLVLEFLDGESLAARLRRGPLPLADTLRYGIEIADALDTAHRRAIVHRDLKPGNIFLTSHGECKVLDFGLAMLGVDGLPDAATATDSLLLTKPGSAIGTLPYMSPEQARGELLDARTDVFSLGAVLYEMATGNRAFEGKTTAVVFKSLLDDTPSPTPEVNSKLPQRLADILIRALEKDRALRYQSAAELRSDLQRLKRDLESGTAPQVVTTNPRSRRVRQLLIAAAVLVLIAALGIFTYFRHPGSTAPPATTWEQLTFFTDSAVYPTLSPDGRILAFIRGNGTFFGPGELYVKLLPSGEPVQLTHDAGFKLSPQFSPDGSRLVYGTVAPFDTWEVPVLGGAPQLFLRNASSLTWLDNGNRLLFSEIKQGLHMGLVTTDEGRGQSRDVYFPTGERSMAHHSYLSPDGRWVVAVVMDNQGTLLPCRLVPFDGSSRERAIGPPDAICSTAAWSTDGRWIYLSSNKGGRFHIWRQQFPDGKLEQVTSGTTEEEGIAIAPDGKSFLTSVGVQDSTIWIHDAKGDRQLSSEGNAFGTSFSRDGRKLYYLMQSGQSSKVELWVTELATGKNERVLPGYDVFSAFRRPDYSVSSDDKQIVFAMKDQNGISHLWLATTNHRSSPRQLPSAANEDSPAFLSNGDLIFRGTEDGLNFLYRMKSDGTSRRKISPDPILDFQALSPDGRWAIAPNQVPDEEHPVRLSAFPVEGGPPVRLCATNCTGGWDLHGTFFQLRAAAGGDLHTYLLPLNVRGLPDLPADGIVGGDDLKSLRKVSVVPDQIDSAISPEIYSYTRYSTRRNIYRIPLP